jgi:hypothetical protein
MALYPNYPLSLARRCGAKTRSGTLCRCPAMWSERSQRYTRCRLHGGASTGPRTPEGLHASKRARYVHGEYSAEARRTWREIKMLERVVFAPDDIGRGVAWRAYWNWIFDEPHEPGE